MGVSSKNMKPATILFFKLCPDKEMAKKFRMLNRAIAKKDNKYFDAIRHFTTPFIKSTFIIYSKLKEDTPLGNFNKRNK